MLKVALLHMLTHIEEGGGGGKDPLPTIVIYMASPLAVIKIFF